MEHGILSCKSWTSFLIKFMMEPVTQILSISSSVFRSRDNNILQSFSSQSCYHINCNAFVPCDDKSLLLTHIMYFYLWVRWGSVWLCFLSLLILVPALNEQGQYWTHLFSLPKGGPSNQLKHSSALAWNVLVSLYTFHCPIQVPHLNSVSKCGQVRWMSKKAGQDAEQRAGMYRALRRRRE